MYGEKVEAKLNVCTVRIEFNFDITCDGSKNLNRGKWL